MFANAKFSTMIQCEWLPMQIGSLHDILVSFFSVWDWFVFPIYMFMGWEFLFYYNFLWNENFNLV